MSGTESKKPETEQTTAGGTETGGAADRKIPAASAPTETNGAPICFKCGQAMVPHKTFFSYLGHKFSTDILSCPVCGQVYIPESLVRGRMARVEQEMEDK